MESVACPCMAPPVTACADRRMTQKRARRSWFPRCLQVTERNIHGAGNGDHPPIMARECHVLAVLRQIRARRQMQGVKGSQRAGAGKGLQRPRQNRRSEFQQRTAGGLSRHGSRRVRAGAATTISRIPAAGWKPGFRPGAMPGAGDPRRQDVQARPTCRLSASSARTSSNRATGGGPEPASAGGASTPERTAWARKASARTGLRGGPSSATTRSRSVTRTVSPDAASRTYSLSLLCSTLIPTDLMHPR